MCILHRLCVMSIEVESYKEAVCDGFLLAKSDLLGDIHSGIASV